MSRIIREIAEALEEACQANPELTVGHIVSSAATIGRASFRDHPKNATNEEILFGLRALVPVWDEELGKWL